MSPDSGVLVFGEFELDFQRLELRQSGRRVEIQPTPLRVLLYLAEQRERTVSKQELLDTLWPDAVVTDTALANALNQARDAVGDDGTAQRVIRTLKGHGYRFVAQAREPAGEAAPPPRSRSLRWIAASGLVVILAAAAAAAWRASVRPAEGSAPGAPLTSIAVLPFDDLNPAGDQAWLAGGMAEELIDMLARIEALRVVGRTSAAAVKARMLDVREAGALLDVGAIVEGSIRRSDDQLRVTAQLLRASDGSHLWTGRYDRQLDDVFALQSEIARHIAEAIRKELGVGNTWSWLEQSRYQTQDVRAWELVRRGVDAEQTYTVEGFRTEIDLCLQAIEIDPGYAQAWAQLAWGHRFLWEYRIEPDVNRRKAIEHARHALELEPTNGAAHNLLAFVSVQSGDWAGAEARLVRALEHTPGHAPLRMNYGHLLLRSGRFGEAEIQLRRATELEPSYRCLALGYLYQITRDYDSAIRECERSARTGIRTALALLSTTYHLNGMPDAALEALVQNAHAPEWRDALRQAYASGGILAAYSADLEQRRARSGKACTATLELGVGLLAHIGDADAMFHCLDVALAEGSPALDVALNPEFDPYRDDPRFADVLRRTGFEP